MMKRSYRSSLVLLTLTIWGVSCSLSNAQFGSGAGGGGMGPGGAGQGALFGDDKRREPEVKGPSLSATDEMVVDIRIEGNQTIKPNRILAELNTRVGRPFDPKIVQQDIRKLSSMSWFVDIHPLYEKTPEGRIVIFRVVERPTIRYVEYLGNERIRDKKLAKETGLKVGGAIDPFSVEEGRRRVEELYHENGFGRVQVTILEGTKPVDRGVTYLIHEGVQEKIWSVSFEGNTFVNDGRLKTQIQSKPGFMRIVKGMLNRETLDGDVDRLTEYYRSFGYFQAKVGRFVEYDGTDDKWANVKFVIQEGPRYNVRNVSFFGNEIFKADSLVMGAKLPAGTPFEQAKMTADVEWVKEVYGSQGYVFADVKAEPIFLEEPGQIDLVYHIEEGKRWRVGRIFVHIDGDNPHTRIQTALNRLSIRPGQVCDIREIKASERRLQASSLFNVDPMRNVSPKITYRIPELEGTEFTAEGNKPNFRGQSPDPAAQAEIVPQGKVEGKQVYEVRMPIQGSGDSEAVDVHLDVATPDPNATAANSVYQVKRPLEEDAVGWESVPPARATPYSGLNTSGSTNPYQQPVQQAGGTTPYSGVAPAVYQAPAPYGGQVPQPTGPAATVAGAGQPYAQQQPAQQGVGQAGQAGAVQPVQYAAPLPSPQPAYIPPGPVVSGPPVATGPPFPTDPNVTPLPGGEIMPGSPWGAPGTPYADPAVDVMVNLEEAQTGRFMVGVGVNSNAGVVGQIVLDERNFDWTRKPTSWHDLTNGTAWRGAGQRFRIEAAPGTQVQRYLASFQEPYLWDTPISFGLSGSYFDRRYDDWDEQRVGGRVSLGYQWTENDLSGALIYRGEDILIHNPTNPAVPELGEAVGHNALHGFGINLANDTRDNPFLATQGHFISLTLEQVLGSFDYPRAEIEARKYFLLNERPDHSGRHVLSVGTNLGFTGDNTPIYDRFYAGGYSTMRGFDFRGASPVKNSVVPADAVQVGGDFMWLNTVEYLFPITADDMLHGVVFCDFGTVNESVALDDFRVAPGVGLRITVPAMGPAPIALDFAWPVVREDTDDQQVFSFFMVSCGNFRNGPQMNADLTDVRG